MIVGTAGHIDHGKTALIKALTGIDADRLREEKERGITIDLGFAYKPISAGEILGFVDVPGHERFIHNMLAGVTGVDYVLLVVAADDGPMPQTSEHLQIVDLLGLDQGVVALTKIDAVSPERRAEAIAEIRALLAPTCLARAEILPVSNLTGEGVADLGAHLDLVAEALPRRRRDGNFRLAIDRCFTLVGIGLVVTGTVFSGCVRADDRLLLSPSGLEVRVRGIHAQGAAAAIGVAGQRCALNLTGLRLERSLVRRGDWVVAAAAHAPTSRFDGRLRLLDSETRALRHWTSVHLHLGSADMPARVALLEGESLAPGGEALAQLVVDRPIGALFGDRFVLRDQSAQRTIGGGVLFDPFPPARGRRTPGHLAALRVLGESDAGAALTRLLEGERGYVDFSAFALARNLTANEAETLRDRTGTIVGASGARRYAIAPVPWASLRHALVQALAAHHEKSPETPGLQVEQLRHAAAAKLPPPVFTVVLEAEKKAGTIVVDGPWLRLPSHAVTLTAAEERLWGRIRPVLRRDRFKPPRVRELAGALGLPDDAVRQLLRRITRIGKTVEVAHDHFFVRETVAEMAAIAASLSASSPGGEFKAAAFRDRLNNGRNLAIQILEFFDRAGVTVRRGDVRRVQPDRVALFGNAA